MNILNLSLSNTQLSLRLTASKLAAFASETGASGNTLFAVMDALDDVSKQGKLLTAALTYKGNFNSIQDGFDLIDVLVDEGYTPVRTKELIVNLAAASGIIEKEDAERLKTAIKTGSEKLYSTAVAVLSGDIANLPNGEKAVETGAENPT